MLGGDVNAVEFFPADPGQGAEWIMHLDDFTRRGNGGWECVSLTRYKQQFLLVAHVPLLNTDASQPNGL
jgi:hypothetical protein